MTNEKNYLNLDLNGSTITTVNGEKITLPLKQIAVVAIQMPYNEVPANFKANDPSSIDDILQYGGTLLIGTESCCRGSLYEYSENATPLKINTAPTNVFDILPVILKNDIEYPVQLKQLLISGKGCDGRGVYLYDGTNYTQIAESDAVIGKWSGFTITDNGIFCGGVKTYPHKTVQKYKGNKIWYNMGEFSKLQHHKSQVDLTTRLVEAGVDITATINYAQKINKVRELY